jgi:ankyrin repeat protein
MYNRDEIFGRLGVDLLERGANPNINDERGFSPILEAVGSINENNDAILELMLQYGLDLNKMEGDKTLKERLESFNEDEMNKIIQKYYKGV